MSCCAWRSFFEVLASLIIMPRAVAAGRLQELDAAEQQAAAGDPAADKQWRQCFVTALNHAVMQGVSAATAAAAATAGGAAASEAEQDKRRWVLFGSCCFH
jgi:hypothetical protein